MKEKYSPHIDSMFALGSIKRQYKANGNEQPQSAFSEDPLLEDENEVVKGLVHKYHNRALIKVSYRCASHCRFCTRYRQIGTSEGDLDEQNISHIINYLKAHNEINDVILSGGDPMYTPKQTIELLKGIALIPSVKVIRIGTRLPVHSPLSFNSTLVSELVDLAAWINKSKPVYLLLNIEHPAELTDATVAVLRKFRQQGFMMFSQTVFLKGVNDEFDTLHTLFENLFHLGIIPYYIYRCDYVRGIESFIVDIEKERQIMTRLRSTLSGLACPTYVVDVPGEGKLPVPLLFWQVQDIHSCMDFNGTHISL